MLDTDWSYIASMLDAEGTIYMGFGKATNREGAPYKVKGKTYYRKSTKTFMRPSLQISINNSHFPLIAWIQGMFGGRYYGVKKVKEHHRKRWTWHILTREAREPFLLGILPYLKIKQEQARLALEWVRLEGKHHEVRQKLAERCQFLNNQESVTTNTPDTRKCATAA
jgi:hypothetical protein